MDTLAGRLSDLLVVLSIILVEVSVIYSQWTKEDLPSGLPWVGRESNKLFAETRANFASFYKVRQWLDEAALSTSTSLSKENTANSSVASNAHAPDQTSKSDGQCTQKILEHKQLSLSTTSKTFLPFGHGRKAWYCF